MNFIRIGNRLVNLDQVAYFEFQNIGTGEAVLLIYLSDQGHTLLKATGVPASETWNFLCRIFADHWVTKPATSNVPI